MLEVAGLAYALNTLLKIAVFSQFLEYGIGSTAKDMLAGFAGALFCTSILYPIDTFKVRKQLGQSPMKGEGSKGFKSLYQVPLARSLPRQLQGI